MANVNQAHYRIEGRVGDRPYLKQVRNDASISTPGPNHTDAADGSGDWMDDVLIKNGADWELLNTAYARGAAYAKISRRRTRSRERGDGDRQCNGHSDGPYWNFARSESL
jgi:hypothetical protein